MKNSTTLHRVTGIALLGAVLAVPADGALADAVSDFYKGNQVKIIVGGTAGGGYAPYSRMLQRHMGRHIPGNPQMVTQYMPGAGGLTATNFIANAAPKDGTVIGAVQRSVVRLGLFGGKRVAYDPHKLQWLGSLHQDVSVCVAWHSSPIKTMQDALTRESVIGAISPNNDTGQFPLVLNNVIGTKFRIIFGYKGSAGITLAMERGEVAGRCGWSWESLKSQKGEWVRDKKVNVFVLLSLRKAPDLPGVPLAAEFAKTDEQRKILEFIFAEQAMGKPFMLAGEVPKDRANALRAAFVETYKDKAALKEMADLGLEVIPMSGEEMDKFVAEQLAAPANIVEAAKKAMAVRGEKDGKEKKRKKKSE
jgi:tripartite-type tricarboxylate transporter receptor subunit TctC